ncbi:MAG: hypothetical protein H5T63_09190, partial [Chloroflexi bacterium]|nr:hypothetical protein [Chloroflexota bacterium]
VDDAYWTQIGGGVRTLDEDWTTRRGELDDALAAWRTNPLARRIVSLTTDYVVGSGISVSSGHEWVDKFIAEFWRNNHMERRCYDWCDELTRSGELFIVMRTEGVSGASFVRAVPAAWIDRIETDPDDYERELRYHEIVPGEIDGRWWQAAIPGTERQEQVMLHYAINRAVGCVRGDGDLTPLLPWLKRYKDWLENRVRLNKYKTAFLWDVTVSSRPGASDVLRQKRFQYQKPPEPGSIIVHGDTEKWEAVSPKIEAWDAKEDGRAIRLIIAAGAGVPLHFLSEGESATRATAAEMGDPTFRHYYHRQLLFGRMLQDLLEVAVRRAQARGRGKPFADLKLSVKFADITKKDNQMLAQSAWLITQALDLMAKHGWVDRQTAIELAMKFAGEFVNVKEIMERVEGDK